MQPRYATFYKPIVKGYTAPLILIGALNGMFGVYLLFAVPYDKISDVEALIFAVITLVVLHKFYKEVYNVERRYRALDELELVRVFVEDAQELLSARVSVCCWRLGWLGWVVEVLIYAGLSLALWLAVGRGEIAWGAVVGGDRRGAAGGGIADGGAACASVDTLRTGGGVGMGRAGSAPSGGSGGVRDADLVVMFCQLALSAGEGVNDKGWSWGEL